MLLLLINVIFKWLVDYQEIEQTVIIKNWDDVKQDVSILFHGFINIDNDLEGCGDLSDSDILVFVTNMDVRYSSDKKEDH